MASLRWFTPGALGRTQGLLVPLKEMQSPSLCQACDKDKSNACPPASVSCLVKSILLARVCPQERSARKAPGIARSGSRGILPGPAGCPGSLLTLPYRLRGEAGGIMDLQTRAKSIPRTPKAALTHFFARRPTASDNSTINQRVGRNSTRGRQQQTCYGGCRVGWGEMDGRKRKWSLSETRQWQELATCPWRSS